MAWFRVASMVAGLMVAMINTIGHYQPWILWANLILAIIWCASAWILLAWRGPRQGQSHTALIIAEVLSGMLISADLFVISFAHIPVYSARRNLWRNWILLTIFNLAYAAFAAMTGDFEVSEAVNKIPVGWAQLLTTIQVVVFSGFAYLAGCLIVIFQDRTIELEQAQSALASAARNEERLRITRDLHDTLGHHLVSLQLNLEVAARKAPAEVAAIVERARIITQLLLADTRDVIGAMRDDRIGDLSTAIRSLGERVAGLDLLLDIDTTLDLPPDLKAMLFHACEEGITNALKHGLAHRIEILIRKERARIVLRITDDGAGCDKAAAGMGLAGMQNRFLHAGGGLGWTSQQGTGFVVTGWLPA